MLLPGITSPAASWEFVGETLARWYDVYIVDNRGRGLSEGGPALGYRLDDYAADTLGLISAIGLERPVVVGHSMGGRIAARSAAINPGAFACVVLVDPPVSGPGRRPYPLPIEWYLDSMEAVSRGCGFEEMRMLLPWSDEHLEIRMEWLPTCDRTAVLESHRSFHEEAMHPDLPLIESPTLLIYAERGNTITDDDAAEIISLLRQGDRRKILGAGHMIPWDQFDAFIEAVIGFTTMAR